MVEINVKKCPYPCNAMVKYYKKTNVDGVVVQLLICDTSTVYTIACWTSEDEIIEVDKMQEITMEEYRIHHIKLKLGWRSDNDIYPYQHGDERGIFRIEDLEKE